VGLVHKIPWWLKIIIKLILSKLPIKYSFWSYIGIFKHGNMDVPEKAIITFEKYYELANYKNEIPQNFVCLELGPGDSILSGMVSNSYGAKLSWLIDEDHFNTSNIDDFRKIAKLLKNKNKSIYQFSSNYKLKNILEKFNINYLTNGVNSFKEIPDNSVDLCWSQVVLEHVSLNEFDLLLNQLHRVLKVNSVSVHSIDFKDHLGGGLNNLRFPHVIWESNFFKSAGFYTNRIRPYKMIEKFENAGFSVEILNVTKWDQVPIKRKNLAKCFHCTSNDNLLISEFLIRAKVLK
jgi:hypothetical protein